MKLTEIIQQHLALTSSTPSGWYTLKCPVCNDYKKRGGFKFDNDTIAYNCFNCSTTAVYKEGTGKISKKMSEILSLFNIDATILNGVKLDGLKYKNTNKSETILPPTIYPSFINKPDHFYPLGENTNIINKLAIEYLQSRSIDITRYSFFMSNHKDWKTRVIIPFYWRGNLIYYQGRDLLGNKKLRYLNSSNVRDKILFNMDLLDNDIVYITEGVFDAMAIDGIAINGNRLTQYQINILNKSLCTKVYIPDRSGGDIEKTIEQVLANGWYVSFPDIGSCKDVNEAVCKYGKLYTLSTIKENTTNNLNLAKIKIKLYIK